MFQIKWVVDTGPAHVNVDVFTRTLPTETWARNGSLCFDTKEWPYILSSIPFDWEVKSKRFPDTEGG